MAHIEYDPKVILAAEAAARQARTISLMNKNKIASATVNAVTSRGAYILVLLKDGSMVEGTVSVPCLLGRENPFADPTLRSPMALRLGDGTIRRISAKDIDQAEVF